ncbi:MAG: peptidase domain-containing ABC transporter [Sandaracinaceae bacterium]
MRRIDETVHLEAEPGVIRAVAERAAAPSPDDVAERAVRACTELGLHTSVLSGSVAAASRAVGPDHPVVGWDANGNWILLSDRRGRSLHVIRANEGDVGWMSRGDVGGLLGAAEETVWVAVDPPGLLQPPGQPNVHHDVPGAPAPTPWARLRLLIRQERHDVLVAVIYAIGVGLLTLATPIAVQALVNTVAFGTVLQPLAVLTLLLLAGLSFAGVLRALQAWVVEVLQRRLFVRLVNDLSMRLPRVELAAFDRAHGPELVNRFFDIFTIQKAASSLLIDGLQIILTAAVGLLVLAFYHPLLLAFDVLLLMIVVLILFGFGRGATKSAVKESKAKYEVASWLEEVARHPTAFKLAGGPALARRRADELAGTYLRNRKKHFVAVFRQLVGALALQAFASAGTLGIGGWLVIERQLTLGQLVAAELIVTMVVASFSKVGKHLETTYDLLAALDKVGQLTDLPLEPIRPTTHLPDSSPRGARLEAKALRFGFGATPLFTDADLHIGAGERVVLTGRSGAGRSALVDVLLGLREPDGGLIEIDGFDLAAIDRHELRQRTALVRGGELVVGSIADNVAFGRSEIDAHEVREALRAVGLMDEVAGLPDGLDTRLMPDGSPLSRGQAARLVLARAVAGRPALLVIDGALDALDPATRATVLDTVFAPDAPWTLLVITDDPGVQVRCARTLAIVDGRLGEPESLEMGR